MCFIVIFCFSFREPPKPSWVLNWGLLEWAHPKLHLYSQTGGSQGRTLHRTGQYGMAASVARGGLGRMRWRSTVCADTESMRAASPTCFVHTDMMAVRCAVMQQRRSKEGVCTKTLYNHFHMLSHIPSSPPTSTTIHQVSTSNLNTSYVNNKNYFHFLGCLMEIMQQNLNNPDMDEIGQERATAQLIRERYLID